MPVIRCQMSADCETDQIVCEGQSVSLVEVVDAPDQPPFGIAPGSEVLDVQIADGQHGRGFSQVGTDFWPQLSPAVGGRSEVREDSRLHAGVFEAEISL